MSNNNSQAVKLSVVTIISVFLSSLSYGLYLHAVRRRFQVHIYREVITGAALVTTLQIQYMIHSR